MTKASDLYDRDFVLWTEEQAEVLRRAKSSNPPLDWDNLAEEIESLGKSDRRELASQIAPILRHLLKLAVSPATGPGAGWRESIGDARAAIGRVMDDSPTLRREAGQVIQKQLPAAAKRAADDLAQDNEPVKLVRARLAQGGFTAEQVLGDWFPDEPG